MLLHHHRKLGMWLPPGGHIEEGELSDEAAVRVAKPAGPAEIREEFSEERVGWYAPEDWDELRVNVEVRCWCERALPALGAPQGSEQSRR